MFKIFKFKFLFQNKTKVAKGRKTLHGEAGCCSPFFFFLFLPVETATSHHPTKVAVGWCVGVRSTKTTRPDTLHLRREELLLATKADGGKNSSRPSAATLRAAYNACDELGPSGGHHSWPSPPPFIANQSLRRRLRLRWNSCCYRPKSVWRSVARNLRSREIRWGKSPVRSYWAESALQWQRWELGLSSLLATECRSFPKQLCPEKICVSQRERIPCCRP